MPRRPRVSIDGGLFHVYNRAAHGAPVFTAEGAGEKFVDTLTEVTRLDGHFVYAWVCLPNHFHVVISFSMLLVAFLR